jgi:hypothetical protein
VRACHQDGVPTRQDDVLLTPVIPVSAGGLVSLQNLIKHDAHTLNQASIQRLERHVQKLAHSSQVAFNETTFLSAECALLDNRNQVLNKMINEAKVRRSTRSLVLGKAKVISFEDIEVARAARAAKDVIKEKGKRGRKRKNAVQEADEPDIEPECELEPEVARAVKEVIKGRGKRGRKSKSATQQADEPEPELARMINAPVPWRAPVARMI